MQWLDLIKNICCNRGGNVSKLSFFSSHFFMARHNEVKNSLRYHFHFFIFAFLKPNSWNIWILILWRLKKYQVEPRVHYKYECCIIPLWSTKMLLNNLLHFSFMWYEKRKTSSTCLHQTSQEGKVTKVTCLKNNFFYVVFSFWLGTYTFRVTIVLILMATLKGSYLKNTRR